MAEQHPLTADLASIKAKVEAECAVLDAQMARLRAGYDALAEQIRPLELQQRDIEAQMDALKAAHRDLRQHREHLRKALPEEKASN